MTTPGQHTMNQKRADQANKLSQISSSMMAKPLIVMPDNKKLCEIDRQMLTRMEKGAQYTASDWQTLFDLPILPRSPDATVFVKESDTLPVVRAGETFF